jgi:hypothetical protein
MWWAALPQKWWMPRKSITCLKAELLPQVCEVYLQARCELGIEATFWQA